MADLSPDPLARIAGRISAGHDHFDAPDEERKQFVLRIPATELFELDFLAAQAGDSRQALAIQLLRAGMQNLWQMLPDEVGGLLTEAYYHEFEKTFGYSPNQSQEDN